jgi:hypothetical protein
LIAHRFYQLLSKPIGKTLIIHQLVDRFPGAIIIKARLLCDEGLNVAVINARNSNARNTFMLTYFLQVIESVVRV